MYESFLPKALHGYVISAVLPDLEQMYALYKAMRGQREIRGAMDFDTQETQIVFAEDRKIDKIIPVQRNDAHKLIEEFMIATNSIAETLS
jgi:ribonuclease R